MRRIRDRDSAAFEALLARHRERARRHLAGLVHDPAAAEDLAQEVFLRVWMRAGQWDGRGPVLAWIYQIATRLALNHLRTLRRRRERPLEIAADPEEEEEEGAGVPGWLVDLSTLGPEAALLLADRRRKLRDLVEDLPEEKREVLRLVQEEEMEIRDVAGALGIPEGTVKSRLHYARKQLARAWQEMEAEEEGY